MSVAKNILQQIQRVPKGMPFGYEALNLVPQQYVTAAKALERLQKKGVVKKVSKGRFYRPKSTVFGEIGPNEQELLKCYLFENGKRIAYVTGSFLYNKLGLTTQVPSRLKIASRSKRITIEIGALKATPIKSYVEVTEKNYELLGLLDALKDFNKIPDLDMPSALLILGDCIKKCTPNQLNNLINYALVYPARVRALLGALLENVKKEGSLKRLKESLNPFSQYKFCISEEALSTVRNWNIL